MSSAICFNLDLSKILSSGNGLIRVVYNFIFSKSYSLDKPVVLLDTDAFNKDTLQFVICKYFQFRTVYKWLPGNAYN